MTKKLEISHISGFRINCLCGGLLVPSRFDTYLRCNSLGCCSYYKIVELSKNDVKRLFQPNRLKIKK